MKQFGIKAVFFVCSFLCGVHCVFAEVLTAASVENMVVYSNANEFAGWPANEGLWQWGDEILVAFEVSSFSEHSDDHNVNREAQKRIAFARSLDGGLTWTPEEHLEIAPPEYLGDPSKHVQTRAGVARPVASPGGFCFTDPGFAMKIRGETFYTSTDRGRSWSGPYILPKFGHKMLSARTNYQAVDARTCRLFFAATDVPPETGEHGRVMMVETTDGGKMFEFISWLSDEPLTFEGDGKTFPTFSLMPGVTSMDDGTLLVALRNRVGRHKWNDVVASSDQGRTWELRSRAVDHNNNPASLINLGGDRVAIVYGYRGKPYGLRAKISADAGRSWSQDLVLRDDAREWDLGYVRATRRTDGRVLVVYYYTTPEIPQNFIAATIWNPEPEIKIILNKN